MTPDTQDYADDFGMLSKMDFSKMIKYAFSEGTEPLYIIITWVATLFSNHYSAALLIWALFPMLSLFRFFKSELQSNKDYSIGIMTAWIIGAVFFFMTAVRQAAALSIILWSYPYFKSIRFNKLFLFDRNFVVFFFCFLAAVLVHNSAVLFIPAFFIRNLKFRGIYVILALVFFYFLRNIQMDMIMEAAAFLFKDRFKHYGTTYFSDLSLSGFLMQMTLFAICYFKKDVLLKNDDSNKFFLNAMLVGLLFESLTGILGEFHRIGFYYSIFAIVLVPRALAEYRKTAIGTLICIMFIIACVIYLFFINGTYLPTIKTSI